MITYASRKIPPINAKERVKSPTTNELLYENYAISDNFHLKIHLYGTTNAFAGSFTKNIRL